MTDNAARRDMAARFIADLLPGFLPERDWEKSFDALGLKSFDMLNLRAALETAMGSDIADAAWIEVQTPADISNILTASKVAGDAVFQDHPARKQRQYDIGMPQMIAAGLSESWLLKEAGDMHWSLLSEGLGTSPAAISDQQGNRLYATFTRFQWQANARLSDFRESEKASLQSSLARFGAGLFFGEHRLTADSGAIRLRTASSFARRTSGLSNKALAKGQPHIAPDCGIPALAASPDFAKSYASRLHAKTEQILFSCDYEIVPITDINGVGLLYFAAIPLICDICEVRHDKAGAAQMMQWSNTARDVFYFANSDMDETLTFRLHARKETASGVEWQASLARKSDHVTIAYVITRKRRRHAEA